MSIANRILDSKYLNHTVEKTNDGRRRVTRRWLVEAPATLPSDLETLLFQAPGTPDGEYSGELAYPPDQARIFPTAGLVAQAVGPRAPNSIESAQYVLTKVYEEATDVLTPVEGGEGGAAARLRTDDVSRRFLTIRYIIRTPAWDTGDHNGEIGVTQPGEDDPLGDQPHFRLNTEQADRGAVLTVVTREFVEANATPFRLGKLAVTRGADNRLRYRETLFQLASANEPQGVIGTDELDGTGAILIGQQSEATDAVRTIQKEWLEPGIVSTSTEFRNQGKLELRNIRAFATEIPTPAGFVLVQTSVENPDGYEITTRQFARGDGRVSTDESTSNNGALTRTRIRFFGGDSENKPAGVLVSTDVVENSGHTQTTEIYIRGEGRVSKETAFRNNGKLELVTVRFFGEDEEESGEFDNFVETGRNVREQDGYVETTVSYAKGDGEISRTVRSVYDDIGAVTEVRYLTAPEAANPPTINDAEFGGTLKDFTREERDGHLLWTLRLFGLKTAGLAPGEVGVYSEEVRYRNNDTLVLTTIRRIDAAPDAPDDLAGQPHIMTDAGFTQRELWKEFFTTWAFGNGEINRSESTRNGGALELLSIRYLTGKGEDEPTPGGTFGFTKIGVQEQQADGHIVWTLEYAKGSGRVSTRTRFSNNEKLERTTIVYLNEDDSGSNDFGVLIDSSIEERDGHAVHTETYVKGEGQISEDRQTRSGGKLILTTRRQLSPGNAAAVNPTAPSASIGGTVNEISRTEEDADGHYIVTMRWAEGNGITGRSESVRDGLRLVELTALGGKPETFLGSGEPAGILLRDDNREEDGVVFYRQVFAQTLRGSPEDWGEPVAGDTLDEWQETRNYTVPGLVTLSTSLGWSLLPPTTQTLRAQVTATIEDSDDIAETVYTVKSWCHARWRYTIRQAEDGNGNIIPAQRRAGSRGFRGYLGSGEQISGISTFMGEPVENSNFSYVSDPAAPPWGQEIIVEVRVQPLFTDVTGTRWFRKTVVRLTPEEPFGS